MPLFNKPGTITIMKHRILSSIKSNFPDELSNNLISLRHELHRFPELSHQEFHTQDRLVKALGLCKTRSVELVRTGIVARIRGRDSSLPPVAIRADMDALPIQETTGVHFASVNTGVMHACGHDVHMAWAIGAARLLSLHPAPADVIIIFQPAEEVGEGAKLMMNSGALDPSISAVFAGHVDRRYRLGEVVHHVGTVSSFSDYFTLEIHGVSAHAARPYEGDNPIPLAADACQGIVRVNQIIGNATNLITVTTLSAGDRQNIIPSRAVVSGTIRCLCDRTRARLHLALNKVAQQTPNATLQISSGSPATINHNGLSRAAADAIESSGGTIIDLESPNMASEDFGVFSNQYPSWYFRFGARPAHEAFIPVHHPNFLADDTTVLVGALVLSNAARFACFP
jgi:amidohydrolase